MDDYTPEEEAKVDKVMAEVLAEFEDFYLKSPFARPERTEFTKDHVYTAMYGSYVAGIAAGISRVKAELDSKEAREIGPK